MLETVQEKNIPCHRRLYLGGVRLAESHVDTRGWVCPLVSQMIDYPALSTDRQYDRSRVADMPQWQRKYAEDRARDRATSRSYRMEYLMRSHAQ